MVNSLRGDRVLKQLSRLSPAAIILPALGPKDDAGVDAEEPKLEEIPGIVPRDLAHQRLTGDLI